LRELGFGRIIRMRITPLGACLIQDKETMKNPFIRVVATEFAIAIQEEYGGTEPADEYFDPFAKLLGKNPERDEIEKVLPGRIKELTVLLEKWLEIELDTKFVEKVYTQALANFYGRKEK